MLSRCGGLTIGPSSFWTAGSTFETRYSWKDSGIACTSLRCGPLFCVHLVHDAARARAHPRVRPAPGRTAATHRRQCSGSGAAGRPQQRPCRGATMGGQQIARGQQPASQQLLAAQPTAASPPLDRQQPGTVTGAGAGAGGARVRLRGVGWEGPLIPSSMIVITRSIESWSYSSLFEADRVVHH